MSLLLKGSWAWMICNKNDKYKNKRRALKYGLTSIPFCTVWLIVEHFQSAHIKKMQNLQNSLINMFFYCDEYNNVQFFKTLKGCIMINNNLMSAHT